jgi:hypothetical protein
VTFHWPHELEAGLGAVRLPTSTVRLSHECWPFFRVPLALPVRPPGELACGWTPSGPGFVRQNTGRASGTRRPGTSILPFRKCDSRTTQKAQPSFPQLENSGQASLALPRRCRRVTPARRDCFASRPKRRSAIGPNLSPVSAGGRDNLPGRGATRGSGLRPAVAQRTTRHTGRPWLRHRDDKEAVPSSRARTGAS